MKKPKFSLGEGGFKGLLINHVEKLVFGMVLVLVAYFIYSSATQGGSASRKSPLLLQTEAAAALTNIKANNWASLAPTRVTKGDRYEDRVAEIAKPIQEGAYALENPLDKQLVPRHGKRGDPKLFAPENVLAEGGVFAISARLEKPEDPFLDDKDAIEKPKEEVKTPKKKEKPKPGGADDYASMMMGSGATGPGPGPKAGKKGGKKGSGSSSDYAEMMGPGGPGGYPGSPGGAPGTGAGMPRQLGATWRKLYLKDAQGGGYAGGGYGAPGGGRVAGRSTTVVAVKALVPFEKQWDEYQTVLAEAQGYNPQQDMPRYLDFFAERAEVSEDPQAPLQWKPVMNRFLAFEEMKRFAGLSRELADPMYLMPGILTMPVPPVLMKPTDSLALHPEVPKVQRRAVVPQQPKEGEEKAKDAGDLTESAPELPKTQPGMGGMGMPYGDPGMMMGGEYGAMMGGSGATGMPMMPGGYPGAGGEYPGGSGSSGPGPGYMMGMTPGGQQPRVKYKLVRFFDFTAEPGKLYRYRVRVRLEDPNRPYVAQAEPNKRILDPKVVKRLADVENQDKEYAKTQGKERRTYWVWTDWSEASNVVSIPKSIQYVASAATAPRVVKLAQDGPQVQTTEASGRMLAVVWDTKRAVEVPGERQVSRGSVFNFSQDVDVLHPLTLRIKTIEKHPFETDGFVVDLRGGEQLIKESAGSGKNKSDQPERILNTPGEYLVVDEEGNLLVRTEAADMEEYRRLMFVEDRPPSMGGPASPGGPSYEGGYDPMMMGSGTMGPGMPPMPGMP